MRQNKLILVLCLMLLNLVCLRLPIKAQSVNSSNNTPKSDMTTKKIVLIEAPKSGTPGGQKISGATRSPELIITPEWQKISGASTSPELITAVTNEEKTENPVIDCLKTKQCLIGLFQNEGKDFTLSSYPTFWFYISSEFQNIKKIKFMLRDPQKDKETIIYDTYISLKSGSNIVKISVPKEAKYALENNSSYRWDLIVFFEHSDSKESDLELNGYIEKLPIEIQDQNSLKNLSGYELSKVFLDNEIWYDAINELAELYFNNPNDQKIKTEWNNLLNSLNLKELSQEKLVY